MEYMYTAHQLYFHFFIIKKKVCKFVSYLPHEPAAFSSLMEAPQRLDGPLSVWIFQLWGRHFGQRALHGQGWQRVAYAFWQDP